MSKAIEHKQQTIPIIRVFCYDPMQNVEKTHLENSMGANNLRIGGVQVQSKAMIHISGTGRDASKPVHRELLV